MKKKHDNDETGKHLTSLVRNCNFVHVMEQRFGREYSDYKAKWREAGEKNKVYDVPLQVDIDLTNTCNMQCEHCNAKTYPKNKKYTIDVEILKQRLDEAIPSGIKSINFGNGSEPLLSRKILFELVDFSRKRGVIDVFVHTNALLLNEENARLILDHEVSVLCISLDAFTPGTFHDIGRKDFKRVMQNIEAFIKIRENMGRHLPMIRLSFLPTIRNVEEIDSFVSFWSDKVDKAELQCFFNMNKNKEIENHPNFQKYEFECDDPWKRLPIWPNNTYGVCCQYYSFDASADMNVGSLYDYSIKDAWGSDKMNQVREQLKSREYGSECFDCVHNTYKCTKGDL